MAHLNVRERRIETKIAYVGPDLAGKATNLKRLEGESARGRGANRRETAVEGGELLSLDWIPSTTPRFNDCELAVTVVAARGELSSARLDELLEDADAVVLVVDAAPYAREENQRAAALVREAMAREARARPVVVQVNKTDLPDALPANDLVATLAGSAWPAVPASALRGEGVIETIELALANVLEALKADGDRLEEPKVDHTPLLSALRQILRDTVTDHMATLERDLLTRVRVEIATALEDVRLDGAVLARIGKLEDAIGALGERVEVVAAAVSWPSGDQAEEIAARVREELEARGAIDREHVATATTGLRKAVDAVAGEVRRIDGLREKELAVALGPLASSMSRLDARIGALEAAVQRELREAIAPTLVRLDDSVHLMRSGAVELSERTVAQLTEIQSGLSELLEELKKRKKGWFG